MKERKVTTYSLAKATQIPKSTIHNYTIGRDNPKSAHIKTLKDFFKVSTDELLFSEIPYQQQLKETLNDFKLKQIETILNS